MKGYALAVIVIFAQIASSASARVPDPSKTWKVVRGTSQCSLTKTTKPKFEVEISDSISGPTLLAMNYASSGFLERPGEIVLVPSGASFVRNSSMWIPGGYMVAGLPNDFLSQLAQSTGLIIKVDGKKKFEYTFADATDGIRSLEACHDILLRSWGIDPDQIHGLSKEPMLIDDGTPVIRKNELDAITTEAMGRLGGGTTVISYTIEASGRVANDCHTILSSGLPTLDAFACSSLKKHARFEPALNKSGEAVSVRIADMYGWAFTLP